jgi:2-polyprenyl-3-methyl-5-hydroxy-6-metoxy-1,4-benzoquinol methylase
LITPLPTHADRSQPDPSQTEPSQNNVDPASLLTFCKATAESQRLDILRVLSAESFGVLELCHIFATPQSGMSHHLKVLANAGLVATRREGNSIFYRRAIIAADNPLSLITNALYGTIDRIVLATEVSDRAVEIHAERAARSQTFFSRNAERLRQNQNLIAEFDQYASSVIDLLGNEQIPASGRVLEVGPGECELINTLAAQFAHITAIDNSAIMLDRAKSVVRQQYRHKVDFRHTDIEQAASAAVWPEHYDLMVLNMVLHHMPSPASVFASARQLLAPGARLLVIDLCPHNQDWARDTCGDLWLGFEPTDLDGWANDTGLLRGQGIYLGLKNGFQIQVRLFHQPPGNHWTKLTTQNPTTSEAL